MVSGMLRGMGALYMAKQKQDADFVEILEDAKKKYEEYLELSKVYALPDRQEQEVQYEPPSPSSPLTTNGIYD